MVIVHVYMAMMMMMMITIVMHVVMCMYVRYLSRDVLTVTIYNFNSALIYNCLCYLAIIKGDYCNVLVVKSFQMSVKWKMNFRHLSM